MTKVILFNSNNNSHNSIKNIIQVLWQRTKYRFSNNTFFMNKCFNWPQISLTCLEIQYMFYKNKFQQVCEKKTLKNWCPLTQINEYTVKQLHR